MGECPRDSPGAQPRRYPRVVSDDEIVVEVYEIVMKRLPENGEL